MAETDISKIVSVIMENPALIEQIRGLVEKKPDERESEAVIAEETKNEIRETEEKTAAQVYGSQRPQNLHRKELLCALKPYVSKERARAIDSMLSIADVLEIMQR